MSDLVPEFRLPLYTVPVTEQWPEADIARAIVCSLPRRFHALDREGQERVLGERVSLTGTRWDALLTDSTLLRGSTSASRSSRRRGCCRRSRASAVTP